MESKIGKLTHRKKPSQLIKYLFLQYLSKPSVPLWINIWEITRKIFPHTWHVLPDHGFAQFLLIMCMNILLLLHNRWVRYHTANIPVIAKKPIKAGLLQHCSGCWHLLPAPSLQYTQMHHYIPQNVSASSPAPQSEGAAVTPAAWGRPVRKSEHHQQH